MEINALEEGAAWNGDRKAGEWRWWLVETGWSGEASGRGPQNQDRRATWGKLTEAEGTASTEAGTHLECQRGLVAKVE